MSSITEVAKLAGVGVGTVSRVFNSSGYVSPETRVKVESAIAELNYVPNVAAKSLVSSLTNTIALVLPTIDHPLFCKLAYYIEQELNQNGFKLMLCNSSFEKTKELEYINMLNENRIDGIIFITNSDIDQDLKGNLPIVTIDRHLSNELVYISSDNYHGGEMIAEHLIEKGCKKLAFIGDFPEVDSEVLKRKLGFVDYATKAGYTPLIIDTNEEEELFHRLESNLNDIDGIFGITDFLAFKCIRKVKQCGYRVPEDIKIAGYDGFEPNFPQDFILTTIKQPMDELGKLSANKIIDVVRKVKTEKRYILNVELIEGTTT